MGVVRNLLALGQAVRKARKRLGLTQAELADRLDVPYSWIQRLESGTVVTEHWVEILERLETVRRWLEEQAGKAG